MMVPASPAPRRAAGGEEVAAQVEQKMVGDFWQSFTRGARFVALVLPCSINKSMGKSKGQS